MQLQSQPIWLEEEQILNLAENLILMKIKLNDQKIKEIEKKVKSIGGLCVIGTERHESRSIDNQLRGRSGRQGDPGTSVFL